MVNPVLQQVVDHSAYRAIERTDGKDPPIPGHHQRLKSSATRCLGIGEAASKNTATYWREFGPAMEGDHTRQRGPLFRS